jgi:hypothetical protein
LRRSEEQIAPEQLGQGLVDPCAGRHSLRERSLGVSPAEYVGRLSG